MNNILIAPSVLSADFSKLKSELDSIANADYIHYDVMDGHFVPNISFGPDIFSYCKKSSELPIDVHLMVTNHFPLRGRISCSSPYSPYQGLWC